MADGCRGSPAVAADLDWDANGVLPVSGGTGAWNTTSPLWYNGATFQAWNNATLDNALFGASAGNVTLAASITVHNMTFNVGGYLFPIPNPTGPTLTFGGAKPNDHDQRRLNAVVCPAYRQHGVTKEGAGSLQLGGTSAGYTRCHHGQPRHLDCVQFLGARPLDCGEQSRAEQRLDDRVLQPLLQSQLYADRRHREPADHRAQHHGERFARVDRLDQPEFEWNRYDRYPVREPRRYRRQHIVGHEERHRPNGPVRQQHLHGPHHRHARSLAAE